MDKNRIIREVKDEQFKEIIYDVYELRDGRVGLILFKIDKAPPLSVLGFAYINEPQHLINILSDLKTFAKEDSRFTRGADIDISDIAYLIETINVVDDKFTRITTLHPFISTPIRRAFAFRLNQHNNN